MVSNGHNPLIPAGYDIAWSIIAMFAVALMIVAIISLARGARHLTVIAGLAWSLVVVLVPVIGPVVWLSVGRRTGVAHRQT